LKARILQVASTIFAENQSMTLQIRIAGIQDAAHIGELLANITDYPQWTTVGAAKLTEHALAGLRSH
jgi:hypothetical protein